MWLITGSNGQLGRCIQDVLVERGIEHRAVSREQLDIRRRDEVDDFFRLGRFSVVVNAAAWTAVDAAETHKEHALETNAEGVRNLARACSIYDTHLIHLSTDYVFDGTSNLPYNIDDKTNPVNTYGMSKLQGELILRDEKLARYTIVRTAWLYSKYGSNFVKTMLRKALDNQSVRVVDDQQGQPTSAKDLSSLILQIANMENPPKLVHGTNQGHTTWFGLATEIFRLAQQDPSLVTPVPSTEFPTPARRPSYSVFSHDEFDGIGLSLLPSWEFALHRDLDEITRNINGSTT